MLLDQAIPYVIAIVAVVLAAYTLDVARWIAGAWVTLVTLPFDETLRAELREDRRQYLDDIVTGLRQAGHGSRDIAVRVIVGMVRGIPSDVSLAAGPLVRRLALKGIAFAEIYAIFTNRYGNRMSLAMVVLLVAGVVLPGYGTLFMDLWRAGFIVAAVVLMRTGWQMRDRTARQAWFDARRRRPAQQPPSAAIDPE